MTHLHGECFVTAGDRTLKIWRIEAEKRRVHGLDVEVGKLKRLINCVTVDERDEIVYCGTSSGDIIKARSHRNACGKISIRSASIDISFNCCIATLRLHFHIVRYPHSCSISLFFPRLNLRDDLQRGEPVRLPVMIGCYSKITRNPRKMKMGEGDLYAGGVRSLLLLKDGKLVVGTGDGTIELIQIITTKENRTHKPSKFPNTPQILTVSRSNHFTTDTL